MFSTREDVIQYVYDNLNKCDVNAWKIGDISVWRLRLKINSNIRTMLIYVPTENNYYFITAESLNSIFEDKKPNSEYRIITDWDEYPCKPSKSEEEYFQLLTSEETCIEIIDSQKSLLLFACSDKIFNSDEYKNAL